MKRVKRVKNQKRYNLRRISLGGRKMRGLLIIVQ